MEETKQALIDLLGGLGAASRFCASGALSPVLPGLSVEGVGEIGLPVAAQQARLLIEQAEQAPYGRGEETIVDTDVRRVWQIGPERLRIANPTWESLLADIVESIKQRFGIARAVSPRLYKLLCYEEGSFFAPHKDSEKEAGMFATLVICLPSQHSGGALVVRHDGMEERIEFDEAAGGYQIQYAAFYADCEHEVEPVTSGHRICLVYNLSMKASRRALEAPRHRDEVDRAAGLLTALFEDEEEAFEQIVVPLAHEYSQESLRPELLKGVDRSAFEVMARAARSADCQLHLALLEFYQSGAPEYDGWFEGRRRGRYGYEYDEPDYSTADIEELFEERWALVHWVDLEGRVRDFGEMDLEPEDILSAPGFELPDRQESFGPTGNDGVTIERWYRTAVLVLWPRWARFRILTHQGQSVGVPLLAEMLEASEHPAADADCRHFAQSIIESWRFSAVRFAERWDSVTAEMLDCLAEIRNLDLARAFIDRVMARDYEADVGPALRALCDGLGWAELEDPLVTFVDVQTEIEKPGDLSALASILDALCAPAESTNVARVSTCSAMAAKLETVIQHWDETDPPDHWGRERNLRREGVLTPLHRALMAIGEEERLETIFERIRGQPARYDLHSVLIPAAREIFATGPATGPGRMLLGHCLRELEARTAEPIPEPTDWARPAAIGCDCQDCEALEAFLRDPDAKVGRFRVNKDRRAHLHRTIEHYGFDSDHVTERKGSPYTLVCTKNRNSYERAKRQFAEDQRLMAELRGLAAEVGSIDLDVPTA